MPQSKGLVEPVQVLVALKTFVRLFVHAGGATGVNGEQAAKETGEVHGVRSWMMPPC